MKQNKIQNTNKPKLDKLKALELIDTNKAIEAKTAKEIKIKYKKSNPNLNTIFIYLTSLSFILSLIKIHRVQTQPINEKVTRVAMIIFLYVSSLKYAFTTVGK